MPPAHGSLLVLFSDLEQLEVSSLCDGVIRFLQDLPGPVLPSLLQADMIRAVQGEGKSDAAVGWTAFECRLTRLLSARRGPRSGGLCAGA